MKILDLYASPSGTMWPGVSYDVPETLGKELIAGGFAVEGFHLPEEPAEEVQAPEDLGEMPETSRRRRPARPDAGPY